jgi:hypothetical protein
MEVTASKKSRKSSANGLHTTAKKNTTKKIYPPLQIWAHHQKELDIHNTKRKPNPLPAGAEQRRSPSPLPTELPLQETKLSEKQLKLSVEWKHSDVARGLHLHICIYTRMKEQKESTHSQS